MSSLPAGTVTFVFTDIEGSTRLQRELGPDYAQVHADHRRILREVFTAAGGQEIDTQGDAFFYSFIRARDAIGAAVAGQRALADHSWPGGAQVRVRIGLHTGEPAVGDEGYLGLDVVRAARISALARGGQILLSETTAALGRSDVPPGARVEDRGLHTLKDMDEPERIHEVVVEGLETAPPPATIPSGTPFPMDVERRASDLSARLQERIEQRVTAQLERALTTGAPPELPTRDLTRIAVFGLAVVVALVVGVILVIVAVRASF